MKNSNNPIFVCNGINNAVALLESNRFNIISINLLKDGRAVKETRIKDLIKNQIVSYFKKDEFYKKFSTGRNQGISIEFSGELIQNILPDFKDSSNICLLALDQIEDPQNFGQIIRTAECAGVDGIIFPQHNSVTVNQTVMQVSQGAFINIPFYQLTNLSQGIRKLKKDDFWIIGLENSIDTKLWHEIDYSGKTVIIVGSEGSGIRKKIMKNCDFKATIPMKGKTNSLNVSAAVSAILFERQRQLNKV
ncbi:MAG: 23S rRNA (guanosine(2251)-2'-O)-methyltransferase RlmB [Candidatus Neomarinimicrobiota bacterium]